MFCFNYPATSGQIPYLNCMCLIYLCIYKYIGIQKNEFELYILKTF
jgi:hypothetical protein